MWLAEKAQEEEKKKALQLKKERDEERARNEGNPGGKERLEWMYVDPLIQNTGPSADQYALGAKLKTDKTETDLAKVIFRYLPH